MRLCHQDERRQPAAQAGVGTGIRVLAAGAKSRHERSFGKALENDRINPARFREGDSRINPVPREASPAADGTNNCTHAIHPLLPIGK